MGCSSEHKERRNFTWTDEYMIIFCNICIEYILKNGRRKPFKWREIQAKFEVRTKQKCEAKSFKNKYDSIKKDWRLWKSLTEGETVLAWDPETGNLDCSAEWWDKKIEGTQAVRKFRSKAIRPDIEELWDRLFLGGVASSAPAPGMNVIVNVEQPMNVENGGNGSDHEGDTNLEDQIEEPIENCETPADLAYSQSISSRLHDLEMQEQEDFIDEENTGSSQHPNQCAHDTFTPKQGEGNDQQAMNQSRRGKTNPLAVKPIQMKLPTRKPFMGLAFARIEKQIDTMITTCTNAFEHMKKDDARMGCLSTEAKLEIRTATTVIKGLVTAGCLKVGDEMWQKAMISLKDGMNRCIFLEMEDDESRIAWLKALK